MAGEIDGFDAELLLINSPKRNNDLRVELQLFHNLDIHFGGGWVAPKALPSEPSPGPV